MGAVPQPDLGTLSPRTSAVRVTRMNVPPWGSEVDGLVYFKICRRLFQGHTNGSDAPVNGVVLIELRNRQLPDALTTTLLMSPLTEQMG